MVMVIADGWSLLLRSEWFPIGGGNLASSHNQSESIEEQKMLHPLGITYHYHVAFPLYFVLVKTPPYGAYTRPPKSQEAVGFEKPHRDITLCEYFFNQYASLKTMYTIT